MTVWHKPCFGSLNLNTIVLFVVVLNEIYLSLSTVSTMSLQVKVFSPSHQAPQWTGHMTSVLSPSSSSLSQPHWDLSDLFMYLSQCSKPYSCVVHCNYLTTCMMHRGNFSFIGFCSGCQVPSACLQLHAMRLSWVWMKKRQINSDDWTGIYTECSRGLSCSAIQS